MTRAFFGVVTRTVPISVRDYGGQMTHAQLLRNIHVDSDTMRRVVETLVQSELIAIIPLEKGGMRYCLR